MDLVTLGTADRPQARSKVWRIARYTLRATLWLFIAYCIFSVYRAVHMPLRSYAGELKPLTSEETDLRDRMSGHVKMLATTIGERNLEHYAALQKSADYIQDQLEKSGYSVTRQCYSCDGKGPCNLEVIVPGTQRGTETVVIGAHYDSVVGTPGANDNASGVAAVLEFAHLMKASKPARTIHFVFFVNEEPPYFQTPTMGSYVYARWLKERKINVTSMMAVETVGAYFDAPGTQHYPVGFAAFYPDKGNFIGFVGNTESRPLVQDAIRVFRETTQFPSEAVSAPGSVTGIGWSDQWSFSIRISGNHGHRHGAVSLRALSPAERHPGKTGLRSYGTSGDGAAARDRVTGKPALASLSRNKWIARDDVAVRVIGGLRDSHTRSADDLLGVKSIIKELQV